MSTFDLTQKVKIVNPNASNDSQYGPYNSITEALTATSGLRELGRTVGIIENGIITEYWFKEGITDEDLIPKTTGSNGSGSYFKEITKDGEFTAEKITGGINDGKYAFKITGNETLEWTIGDTDYVYNLDSNDEWTFIADALGSGLERRIDAVSYGNDGQIRYWKGTETGQASYPNVPENHILKSFVTLTEDGIIIPSPTDLSGYVLKNHFKWGSSVYSVGSGNDVYLIAGSIVGYHNKVVGITNLYPEPELRILGCNINTPLTNKPLWDGVTIHIKFSLVAGKTIRLKNNILGANVPTQAKFLFPDGLDYLPVHNEILTFVLRDTGFFGWKLEFAGSNMVSGTSLTLEQARQNGNVLEGDVEILQGYSETSFYKNNINEDVNQFINFSDSNLEIGSQFLDQSKKTSLKFYPNFIELTSNPLSKGIEGSHEFDKQGDRRAFAQIADIEDAVSLKLDNAPDGINNLIDVDNKLNPVYLPPNIMHLQGEWNAATNTPTLSNGTGVAGYIYEVTTAGTTDFGDGDIEFALGDWVVYGGDGKWYKSPNTGEVVGVKGDNESAYRKGLVNLDIDDIIEPTANEFLVGNSAGDDWEKRTIQRSDITSATTGILGISAGNWFIFPYTSAPSAGSIPLRTTAPNAGRVKGNNAIESDDLVPLGQLEGKLDDIDLQKTLDNGNIADGVGIMLTDGSSVGQYYADSININAGTTGISMSKAQEGFLYAGANGRVHLGDRDGVVGLNFETLTNKMNVVPPASFGNATHTLQNKSGTLAHLSDIETADGSVTNAKLANMPANSIKGRASASAGEPSDIAISASRLVGRGSMGNLTGLTVGGGLTFSGTQLNSDIYRDNYETSPAETQDTWIDDRTIQKMTFVGTSTGVQQIELTSFGIDSIISIEGMYVEKNNDREVPCNYQRFLTPETNANIEVTTCYRNSSTDRLYLSWHDVISGTVRPVEFTYNVTIKYVK